MHAQPQASSEQGRAAGRLTALCCAAGDERPATGDTVRTQGVRGGSPSHGSGGRGGGMVLTVLRERDEGCSEAAQPMGLAGLGCHGHGCEAEQERVLRLEG